MTRPLMSKLLMAIALQSSYAIAGPMSIENPDSFEPLREVVMDSVDTESLRNAADLRQFQESSNLSDPPFEIASGMQTDVVIDNWEFMLAGGEQIAVARYEVISEGATNLSLGFSEFFVPEGAEVYIYSPDGSDLHGPYDSEQNESHGQLWTPLVAGDRVIVEVNVPEVLRNEVVLRLQTVNHGFRGEKPTSNLQEILKSGSCNVDVVCSQGDDWRDQINSVAHYSFSTGSGSFVCTGAAINNTAQDNRRLFLTADHCLDQPEYANTVVAYWNFQSPTCRAPGSSASGQTGVGPRNINQSGAVMLVQNPDSDFALIEFDDPIPEEANVFYAGWNRSSNTPTQGTSIHHPAGHEKRISHDFDPLTAQTTHWRINDWDVGTTEGGSSGSPLFDAGKRIVGQLTGGLAACGNNEYDIYGRMDVNWQLGIGEYLDPNNVGVVQLDGRYPNGIVTPPPTPTPTPIVTPAPGDKTLFEAETASLTGIAETFLDDAASGGQGVAFLSELNSSMTLRKVPASNYFELRFASEFSGAISVSINGIDVGNLSFSATGGWVGAYDIVRFEQDIPSDASVTIFYDSGDTAMNVDYLEFNVIGGSTPTPIPTPTFSCNTKHTCVPTPTPTPPTPTPTPTFSCNTKHTCAPTPTPTIEPTPNVSGGWNFIIHKPTGAKIQSCADVDGTPITSRPNSNRGNCVQWAQIFTDSGYFHLQNRVSEKFMKPDTNANGSPISVQPNTWKGNWTQWQFELRDGSFGHIINRATGKYIFLSGKPNSNIEQQPSSWRGDFTRWIFEGVN